MAVRESKKKPLAPKYPPGTGFGGAPRPNPNTAPVDKPIPKYPPGTGFGGAPRPNPALVGSLVDKPIPTYPAGTGFGGLPRPGPLGTDPIAGRLVDAQPPPDLASQAAEGTKSPGRLAQGLKRAGSTARTLGPVAAGATAAHYLKDDSPELASAASTAGLGASLVPGLARMLPAAMAGGRVGRLAGPMGMLVGTIGGGLWGLRRGTAAGVPEVAEEPVTAPDPGAVSPQTMMAYQALIQQYLQPYVQAMLDGADQRRADAGYWADKVPASYRAQMQAGVTQTDALQRQLANSAMVSAQQIPALWAYEQLARQAAQPAATDWTAMVPTVGQT